MMYCKSGKKAPRRAFLVLSKVFVVFLLALGAAAALTSCDQFEDMLIQLGLKEILDTTNTIADQSGQEGAQTEGSQPAPDDTEQAVTPPELGDADTEKVVTPPALENADTELAATQPETELNTIEAVIAYLDAQDAPGGAAIPLIIGANYDDAEFTWPLLLEAIRDSCEPADKKVALDLSATDLALASGDVFDPRDAKGSPYNTGEEYIKALVLPNKAVGIQGDKSSDMAFAGFNRLSKVSAAAVDSIGDYAFNGLKFLSSADFPAAVSIGNNAFSGCTALSSADFPAAVSIGTSAFNGCAILETTRFPKVKTIGGSAFNNCSALKTAKFPEVKTIEAGAFASCSGLTGLAFPVKPPAIGKSIFQSTGTGAAIKPLYIYVGPPADKGVEAYMNDWGVAEDTEAGENLGVYGTNHKRVIIAYSN